MFKSKENLRENGFIFDYGWKKRIEIKFFEDVLEVDVIFDAYKIEDQLSENQFETYDGIEEKINRVVQKDKNKILDYLKELNGKEIEGKINKYIEPRQIILEQSNEKDIFGIYCESILDKDEGIGIEIKGDIIEKIGSGDIVI